jgi:protein-S-isoprenylcysteine O-methyltransferase Ste14
MEYFVILAGLLLFPILTVIEAPYGKFYRSGFGLQVNGKLGWFVFESIPWISFLRCLDLKGIKLYFVGCWMIHYINRSIIYTYRAPSVKPTAISAVLGAILFNIVNGYTNTNLLIHTEYWSIDLRIYVGSLLFWAGFYINIRSDNILFALKAKGKGYQIPHSFLYEFISCPNYFGEILEWLGWAVMTWSLPGFAFFVFTCSNLIPRALKTHVWYSNTFKNYPNRKAIIPYLL